MERTLYSIASFFRNWIFTFREISLNPKKTQIYFYPQSLKDKFVNPVLFLLISLYFFRLFFTIWDQSGNSTTPGLVTFLNALNDRIFNLSITSVLKETIANLLIIWVSASVLSKLFFWKNIEGRRICRNTLLYTTAFQLLLSPILVFLLGLVYKMMLLFNYNMLTDLTGRNRMLYSLVISLLVLSIYSLAVPHLQFFRKNADEIYPKNRWRFHLLFPLYCSLLIAYFAADLSKEQDENSDSLNSAGKYFIGNIRLDSSMRSDTSSYDFTSVKKAILPDHTYNVEVGSIKIYLSWLDETPVFLQRDSISLFFIFNDTIKPYSEKIIEWSEKDSVLMTLKKGDIKWIRYKGYFNIPDFIYDSFRQDTSRFIELKLPCFDFQGRVHRRAFMDAAENNLWRLIFRDSTDSKN